MKVLMLNGSPKANGNTMCALTEIGEQLKKEGIDYEIFQIGSGRSVTASDADSAANRAASLMTMGSMSLSPIL